MSSTPAVSIKDVKKLYGTFTALKRINLEIADNEFFTLLGPSGCGKTTLLRLIAGFEDASAGALFLYGQEIEDLPPHKRPINTVFQSYALFPHMSVAQNIGFGLKMLGWPEEQIQERIVEMVSMVRLDEFVERKPSQLSGGQQQRVALARAMAPRPKVLLLDEPLSALDLKLRQQMRSELKQLQRDTGITFIFVTHDQEEALSMSDRIAVMSAGEVQQVGTPDEIYESPANRFIANFIGETNLIAGSVLETNDVDARIHLITGDVVVAAVNQSLPVGAKGVVSLRPERLRLRPVGSLDSNAPYLTGTMGDAVYLGTDHQYRVQLPDGTGLMVRVQNSHDDADVPTAGNEVLISLSEGAARFLVN